MPRLPADLKNPLVDGLGDAAASAERRWVEVFPPIDKPYRAFVKSAGSKDGYPVLFFDDGRWEYADNCRLVPPERS